MLTNDFLGILNSFISSASLITQKCLFAKNVLQSSKLELFLTDVLPFWRNKGLKNVNKPLKVAEMFMQAL